MGRRATDEPQRSKEEKENIKPGAKIKVIPTKF